jgi:hypothetical protein
MCRLTGLVLALVLVVAAGQEARAQAPVPGPGGFGFEYTQTLPSNSLILDRWWMLEATPAVGTALPPPAVVQQPAAVEPANPGRAARPTRVVRSFSRVSSRPLNPAGVQPTTSLPTGSLYWPGAAGVPLYSPAQRYATYGQGYGVSPYGTADYGAAYKGY